jgi:hypothetical protein
VTSLATQGQTGLTAVSDVEFARSIQEIVYYAQVTSVAQAEIASLFYYEGSQVVPATAYTVAALEWAKQQGVSTQAMLDVCQAHEEYCRTMRAISTGVASSIIDTISQRPQLTMSPVDSFVRGLLGE